MALPTALETILFTDGACSGNPGPGGWGAILMTVDGQISELGGGNSSTTNNRMELRAAVEGLRIAPPEGVVNVYTDSTYMIRGITQWIFGWRRKGWVTAEGEPVQNRDLWEELDQLVRARGKDGVRWLWVKGHSGNPGNERVDEIAVAFSQNRRCNLYRGPITRYDVDLLDLPEPMPLPEMKPKLEKKAAFSYLSNLGGKVVRHTNWASCERRVKGQSGARFKKAQSADDEVEILNSWGVSPTAVKSEGES